MLETVRQYARDRLGEQPGSGHWQSRHLAHFLALAEDGEEGLRGVDQLIWFAKLDADLRQPARFAYLVLVRSSADKASGLRMAGALFPFCIGARIWPKPAPG